MKKFIVLDVGGSSIKHGIMNEKGELLESGSIPNRCSVIHPEYNEENNIDSFIEAIGIMVDEYKTRYDVEGIACSFPGAVDVNTGIIGGASATPCIHGPNIRELLEKRSGLRVSIENDANCAGLAEGWIGAAKDVSNYICIVVGTGIGGCVVINNEILRGKHLHGGEFGFMLIRDIEGDFDDANWSRIASTNALVERVAKAKGITKDELNGKLVFEMAEYDEVVKEEIKIWYSYLARGIYNIQYVVDPEKIVVGGAISAREDFHEKINESLCYLRGTMAGLDIKVEKCVFNNESNLIGALYHFLYVDAKRINN